MNSFETIRRWAVLFLAEVLNLSASVAETILFGQPRWVAHLRLMEGDLRAGAARAGPQTGHDGPNGTQGPDLGAARKMLESYAILNRTLKDIEARGLALDDALIERMKAEWTPGSIVGYLQTCDAQLRQRIGETLEAAAAILGTETTASGEPPAAAAPAAAGSRSPPPSPPRSPPRSSLAGPGADAPGYRNTDLESRKDLAS